MQKPKTILIIDKTHNILPQKLKSKGYKVDIFYDFSYEDVKNNISLYDCIVVRSKIIIDKAIIDNAKNLKCIARTGAGMDAIDVEYAQSKNIVCLNSPEGNRDAVGEHTLGLLLSLLNKINFADYQVRQSLWQREENRGEEIKGKVVGIIGYGNMGQAFAKRLQGFDCSVIAYDKYKQFNKDKYAIQVDLDELFKQTDILSLHIPLTNETKMMINKQFIDKFHKNIYLLNTSRGKIVSIKDLLECLQQGKVKGCGLDVLEIENYNQNIDTNDELYSYIQTLYQMKNTVFTPHVAGWTKESYFKLADVLADKIINTLEKYN